MKLFLISQSMNVIVDADNQPIMKCDFTYINEKGVFYGKTSYLPMTREHITQSTMVLPLAEVQNNLIESPLFICSDDVKDDIIKYVNPFNDATGED